MTVGTSQKTRERWWTAQSRRRRSSHYFCGWRRERDTAAARACLSLGEKAASAIRTRISVAKASIKKKKKLSYRKVDALVIDHYRWEPSVNVTWLSESRPRPISQIAYRSSYTRRYPDSSCCECSMRMTPSIRPCQPSQTQGAQGHRLRQRTSDAGSHPEQRQQVHDAQTDCG